METSDSDSVSDNSAALPEQTGPEQDDDHGSDTEQLVLAELRSMLRNCVLQLGSENQEDDKHIQKALFRIKKYHVGKNPEDLEVVCDVVKVLATSVFSSPRFEAAIERWTNPVAEALLTDQVAREQLRQLWSTLDPGANQ